MLAQVQEKYDRLSHMMNERLRRRWAACEALVIGRGGISAVSDATGLSRTTYAKVSGKFKRSFLNWPKTSLPGAADALEVDADRCMRPTIRCLATWKN